MLRVRYRLAVLRYCARYDRSSFLYGFTHPGAAIRGR
jgi:hypothetical protein